jgi:hypothetical protein
MFVLFITCMTLALCLRLRDIHIHWIRTEQGRAEPKRTGEGLRTMMMGASFPLSVYWSDLLHRTQDKIKCVRPDASIEGVLVLSAQRPP